MKKVILILIVVLSNSVLTSCTNLNDELELELQQQETFNTGDEDGHIPVEETDPMDKD